MSEADPSDRQNFYQWQAGDLLLNVYVQPRASSDEIVGLHGNALKIRITAPPVDSKANKHLIKYLAGLLKIPASKIELISGANQRNKRLRISPPPQLPEVLSHLLESH